MKKISTLLLIVLFVLFSTIKSENNCEPCIKQPTKFCCTEFSDLSICKNDSPGDDNPDDNNSFSTDNGNRFYFITPEILIYKRGYYDAYKVYEFGEEQNALTDLKESLELLRNSGKALVIPSGALVGKAVDSTLKLILEQYVKSGGTIVVFAQQFGYQVDSVVPVPEGETLKSYGWREDQSCEKNSVYYNAMHPVMSSSQRKMIDAGIDGHFTLYPSNSTVLLRRISNNEPAMISYPYGENGGHVILTSLFTDWAYAHSQASSAELKIVRDLITWAKNPNLTIPQYDLAVNPNPEMSYYAKVKNDTEYTGSKVKIYVYTPDRNILLYQTEASITLAPGQEGEIPVSFTLPEIQTSDLGICHTEYEIYDADDLKIKIKTESDEGRFALYKITDTSVYIGGGAKMWVTAEKESIYWDEDINVTINFENNAQEDRPITEVAFTHDWNHGQEYPVTSATLSPKEKFTYNFTPERYVNPGTNYISRGVGFNLKADAYTYGQQGGAWLDHGIHKFLKGFQIYFPQVDSNVLIKNGKIKRVGDPVNYDLSILNKNAKDYNINVKLKIFDVSGNLITENYSQTVNLKSSDTFNYSGTFTPSTALPPGSYKIKAEIEKPDGNKEFSADYFEYQRSSTNLVLNRDIGMPVTFNNSRTEYYIVPGRSGSLNFSIENKSSFAVNSGYYKFEIVSKDGQHKAYEKSLNNISFSAGEKKSFTENFTFTPPAYSDRYILRITYGDETRSPEFSDVSEMSYKYESFIEISTDKNYYYYPESIGVTVKISGFGNYHVGFNCGTVSESREITIADDTFTAQLNFNVPVVNPSTIYNNYKAEISITDNAGNVFSKSKYIDVASRWITAYGVLDRVTGVVSDTLPFTYKILDKSSTAVPVNGVLKVLSTALGFSDVKNVTIVPGTEIVSNYSIPIPSDLAPGIYNIDTVFEIAGVGIAEKSYSINIPAAALILSKVSAAVNLGDSVSLEYKNDGGRSGDFAIKLKLTDISGKAIKEASENRIITANGNASVDFIIPPGLKSGKYVLSQSGTENVTGKVVSSFDSVTITGLEASLNSYTLKDEYLNNENVIGKSEITSGNGDITGTLKAKIVKYTNSSSGITELNPDPIITKFGHFTRGCTFDSKLYLIDSHRGLVEYDTATGNSTLIYDLAGNADSVKSVFADTSGEIWVSTTWGIYRRDSSNTWTYFNASEGNTGGVAISEVYDWKETSIRGGNELWMATSNGILVFNSGAWSIIDNITGGLPDNYVYKFAEESSGNVWVSTAGGVVKYSGTSFSDVGAPFGTTNVMWQMGSTNDGTVYVAVNDDSYSHGNLYIYSGGLWTEKSYFNIFSCYPSIPDQCSVLTYINEVKSDDSAIWFSGVLDSPFGWNLGVFIRYNGEYSDFVNPLNKNLTVTTTTMDTIIPKTGEGIFFLTEESSSSGEIPYFIEYTNNLWKRIVLTDDLNYTKIAGYVNSINKDGAGNLLFGTDSGYSKLSASGWSSIYKTDKTGFLGNINSFVSGADGFDYLFSEVGIVKTNSTITTIIPYPEYFYYDKESTDFYKMTVDGSLRIWLSDNLSDSKLYYYSSGAWHEFNQIFGTDFMYRDNLGGIWCNGYNYSNEPALFHIKNDLTYEEFDSSNSPIPAGNIGRIVVDGNNIVWISVDDISADRPVIVSFNGTDWVNTGMYNGFPDGGVITFTLSSSGKLYAIGRNADYTSSIFTLEGTEYRKGAADFTVDFDYNPDLAEFNDEIYSVIRPEEPSVEPEVVDGGGEGSGEGDGEGPPPAVSKNILVKFLPGSGISEEVVWTKNYSVNITSGGSENIDLLTGKTLNPGTYLLRTGLISSLDQKLFDDDHIFSVISSEVSALLSGKTESGRYLKSGSDLNVSSKVSNNTLIKKTGLQLVVTKTSPSQAETEILNSTIDLNPGESRNTPILFNETEKGIWVIHSSISENGVILSESEMSVEVVEPQIRYSFEKPDFAGDEQFEIKTKFVNIGKISSVFNITLEGLSETDPGRTITLKPAEEQVISWEDLISTDKNYTLGITGDVEKREDFTVSYGYKEIFNLNNVPAYREGNVLIGYSLSNGGGLAFKDDLHFELFTVGGTLPIYSIDRSYNLYPGKAPIAETLKFDLLPGNYILKYRTTKTAETTSVFVVNPSGIAQFIPDADYKFRTGLNEIGFKIKNADTVAGNIPLKFEIKSGETVLLTETRSYFIEPNAESADKIVYDFTAKGNYTLNVTGAKIQVPFTGTVRVLNREDLTYDIQIGTVSGAFVPVNLSVQNDGFEDFNGSLVIRSEGFSIEEKVTVNSEQSVNSVYNFNTELLTAGTKEIKASLYDSDGSLLLEKTGTALISGADIRLTEYPEDLEINAGSHANINLKLKNEGNIRGKAVIHLTAFTYLNEEIEVDLGAGEEIELNNIDVEADEDLPTGSYPVNYTLTGNGVVNGINSGSFNFNVLGVKLNVSAAFGESLYSIGDTAVLTIDISTLNPTETPLEVNVNWGEFSSSQDITLSSGSTQVTFEIPVDKFRQEKVFYGIYHKGGKGIYLNDIYLYFTGAVSVELNKQVFEPGEMVQAMFTTTKPGTLTTEAFGNTQTAVIASSEVLNFQIPVDSLGGTYGISWNFIPTDINEESVSGSTNFDVSGLVVKVAKSRLEKGKYSPGDNIKSVLTFESNRDISLDLRTWIVSPLGEWKYNGSSSVSLSAVKHIDAIAAGTLDTTEAGTHKFVYGLYRDGKLVVSGSLAFNVGDAVLLGITTDKYEYKEGNESVNVKVEYFGEGSAALELFMDDQVVETKNVTINGIGEAIFILSSNSVNGGNHNLKAVITKDSLKSEKTATFLYGSNLPDLTVSLSDITREDLNLTYKITVANSGKSNSGVTTLGFSDNGAEISSVSVPALESNGIFEHTFLWSGSGKAGDHEFVFEVDKQNSVKEFDENNNSLTMSETIPKLYYTLKVIPEIWKANTDANIFTKLINNKDSAVSLTLNLAIENQALGNIIFSRTKVVELAPMESKTITDIFSTGVIPAGEYRVVQDLSGENSDLTEEVYVIIELTKLISGNFSIVPETIQSGMDSDVELIMNLKNSGNVNLEDENYSIVVTPKDEENIVFSKDKTLTLGLGEEREERDIISLNLEEGVYQIKLIHSDKVFATTDLNVTGGFEKSKSISSIPRVLLMNIKLFGIGSRNFEFVKNVLESGNIKYRSLKSLPVSYLNFLKGENNINIILGSRIGAGFGKELKERIFRGEGMIFLADGKNLTPFTTDFLGVKVKNIPASKREKNIDISDSVISNSGSLQLKKKNKYQLKTIAGDVEIIGKTRKNGYPVISYRKYGNGHILVISLPMDFQNGAEKIAQLILNSISYFNVGVYSLSDLERIVPLEFVLKNTTGSEKEFIVKEIFPYGVSGYGYEPGPEEGEELKWKLTIAGGNEKRINYWVKLPDIINNYDIKSEIYSGENKLDEVSIQLDVNQIVLSRLDEIILEIDSISVSGSDRAKLNRAKKLIQKIRNRSGNKLLMHLFNLKDSRNCASLLADINNTIVSSLRRKMQNILIVMERRVYDKLKELNFFGFGSFVSGAVND